MSFSSELSQVVYRIGDSVTNVISPMMSFFALIIAFLIFWILLLVVWLTLGIMLGPDAGIHYTLTN